MITGCPTLLESQVGRIGWMGEPEKGSSEGIPMV